MARPLLRLLLLAPLGLLFAGIALVAWAGSRWIAVAAAGQPAVDPDTLWPWLFGICGGLGMALVVGQGLRVAHHLAGPEHQLCMALRRIRSGDLAFRVQLRAGDLLGSLASECNALLDWLNHNPPGGACTGSDVVRLSPEARQPDPASGLEPEEVA